MIKLFYLNKGVVLNRIEKYKQALDTFDQGLKLNPDDSNLYNNKGVSYFRLEDYKSSIDMYDKSIELNHNDSFPLNNKGISLKCLRRFKESLYCFEKGIQIDPVSYCNKANCLRELGNYNEALNYYDKAKKKKKNYSNSFYYKGITYNYLGNYKEAIKNFTECIEK